MIGREQLTVMVLAAGLGTRLRPLTNELPKQMLPLADGRPLLEHILLHFRRQGFRRFVINLHHLPEKITGYFGDGSKWGIQIDYSDESDQRLETGGAIKKAAPLLSDPFVLYYGDILTLLDFSGLLALHEASGSPLATLVLKRSDLPQNGDLAEVDTLTNRITRWYERPHSMTEYGERLYLNGGASVLSKKLLDFIPPGRPVRLDLETLPPLIRQGAPIYGFVTGEELFDIGTLEKYEYARRWHARAVFERDAAAEAGARG